MISEEIARSVHLHIHGTKKFKTQVLSIIFLWPMNPSIRAESFLLSYLMADTTEHFPRKQDLLSYLDHLYGATFNVAGIPRGSCGRLKFTFSGVHVPGLNDDLIEKLISLASECIFYPRIENGIFPDAMFQECLEQAVLSVKILKDDPQTRCGEAAARCYGGAMAYRILPSPRQLKEVTPESCVKAWNWIRDNARVDIQVLSDRDDETVHDLCVHAFPFTDRESAPKLTYFKPGKSDRTEITKNIPLSHINLLFESGILFGDADYPAYALGNGIFGGLPSSLLFQNVREKQGYCYSVESGLLRYDGVLRVSTAVDGCHIDEAIECILEQLEVIKKGTFSDEELSIARHMYVNINRSQLDDPDAILSEQYRRSVMPGTPGITEMIKIYKDMDRESIVKAFSNLTLKTVSIVRQER